MSRSRALLAASRVENSALREYTSCDCDCDCNREWRGQPGIEADSFGLARCCRCHSCCCCCRCCCCRAAREWTIDIDGLDGLLLLLLLLRVVHARWRRPATACSCSTTLEGRVS